MRALRAEVIDVRHSSVLLAHYGRLGSSFDLSAKIIVDILREEGMYNDNGIFVVSVIEKALKDVRLFYLFFAIFVLTIRLVLHPILGPRCRL